jgi:hypothetical protein
MSENELIEQINAELTNSCALDYSLPIAEIKRIIKRSSEWFYVNYQYAVEGKYMVLPKALFDHPQFKAERKICMPDDVIGVEGLREIKGGGMMGNIDPDFSDAKLFGAEIFLAPFQGDNLVYRTAMFSYYDLAQSYILETVAYKFNTNTKRLWIRGRDPRVNLVATIIHKIPLEDLYEDDIFKRYCEAKAKINLGRILSIYEFNLPGGVRINFDGIKQDGIDELAKILEQIDSENTPDWFYQYHI